MSTEQSVAGERPEFIKLSSREFQQFWKIEVLYEDSQLLALNKPADLSNVANPEAPDKPSLMPLLHAAIAERKSWAAERNITYLKNLYTLDAEVSGVLLLVKDIAVFDALAALFGSEKPLLNFLMLCHGAPGWQETEVSAPVGPDRLRPGVMRIDPKHGKKSRTIFHQVELFNRHALVRAQPLTLRPHQVRLHARKAGNPVVGDRLYGGKLLMLSSLKRDYRLKPNREERPLLSSPALYLESIRFPHPVTGAQFEIHAPAPKDLSVALKYLKKYSGADQPV